MKKETVESNLPHWRHPGGKLVELGAEKLSDAELLTITFGGKALRMSKLFIYFDGVEKRNKEVRGWR